MEALKKNNLPDLILLDMRIQIISGPDFCGKVLKDKNLKALAMTLVVLYPLFYGALCYALLGLEGVFMGGIILLIILILYNLHDPLEEENDAEEH